MSKGKKQADDKLRVQRARLEHLFQSTPEAIVLSDTDGLIVQVNEEFSRLFGYTPQEAVGRPLNELTASDELLEEASRISRRIEQGQKVNIETVRQRKDGSQVHVSFLGTLILHRGQPIGRCAVYRDITEQKQAEAALWSEKERFRILVDELPLGVSLIKADGSYQYLNSKFVEIFGYSLEDIPTGREWFRKAYPDPEYRRQVISTWINDHEKLKVGEARPQIFTVTCKDGSPKVIHFRPVRLKGYDQLVIYEDISQRIRSEEALRESKRRYRQLFDSISDFIFSYDLEGRFMSMNTASDNVLGYPPAETIGRFFTDFMRPEDRQAFRDEYLAEIKDQGHAEGVLKLVDKAGNVHHIECRNSLVKQEGQEPYVSGSGRDITERVMAQRQLKKLEEQLSQAQKMEAVGTLASGIAHDFNNILQAISGYIQLLLTKETVDRPSRNYLSQIDLATERAAELVQRLLTFSRKKEADLRPLDLNQQVVEAVKMLERTIPKMISIETRLADDLKLINGDPTQLEQVLMNLGTNARDAMPQGGRLIIETRNVTLDEEYGSNHLAVEPGQYVLLKVADTGQGMNGETKQHIFEPFFTTKDTGQGTGLGLSTVYGIVKAHGGHMTCYSESGLGTTFNLYLPVLKTKDLQITKDNHDYQTLAAETGEKALEIYQEAGQGIDLVILDLGMPGLGGEACLKELLKINPQVKVIVASGYSDQGRKKTVLQKGAQAFIAKPYRLTDLLQKTRQVLDS